MGKQRRSVTVSAVGKAAAVPDQLTVSLGVLVRGDDGPGGAAPRPTSGPEAAIAAFKDGGVEDRDLATANLTIWPEYGENRRVEGYQAQQHAVGPPAGHRPGRAACSTPWPAWSATTS